MAVTLDAAALRSALKLADDAAGLATATRLLPVATAAVNRYASAAPEAVANEATIRTAGYLLGAKPQAAPLRRMQTGEGTVEFEFREPGSALRLSGAQALLAPYRVRRAPGGTS